jgi:nucleoid-associated protein YgaU
MMSAASVRSAPTAEPSTRRGRPHLVVLEGGRGQTGFVSSPPCRPVRLPAAVARRRRRRLALVGLVVAALFAAAGWFDRRASIPGGPGGSASASLDASPPLVDSGNGVYVVRAGDTLWSIARRVDPDGDVRATVDRLVAAHGSATVDVGDRIPIDELSGGP